MNGPLRRSIRLAILGLLGVILVVTGLGTLVMPLVPALLLGVAIAGLMGWWLATRLTAPLERLARLARPWADRTGDRLPPPHGGGDEVDAVTTVLESLGASLRAREGARELDARQLRQILETMIEGVLVIGPDGRISLDNATMRRLLPTIGVLKGRTAIEALRSPEFDTAVRRVLDGGPAPVLELSVGAADRSLAGFPRDEASTAARRTFRVSLAPLRVGEGGAVVAVFHDVSRLRDLENLRRDFVANVSHELRTPLTAIKGYVETLRDGEVAPADRTRFLDIVSRHTDRLSTLIEDLLELSRLESPETKLDIRPLELPLVVQRALALFEGAADHGRVRLVNEVPDPLPQVAADARGVEQVLINLLDNAIKYTPAGGTVTVSAARMDGRVQLSVRDTGVGIPATDHAHLFERFYRVDRGRSREQGGTGLGLAIVKHLVHLQGGETGMESRFGQGSTFWFTLRTIGTEASVARVTKSSPSSYHSDTEGA